MRVAGMLASVITQQPTGARDSQTGSDDITPPPQAADSRQVCRNAVIVITKALACSSAPAAAAITLHGED